MNRKLGTRWLAISVLVVGLCSTGGVHASDLVFHNRRETPASLAIVVNLANPVNDLSTAELHKLFLGRRTRWANGRRVAAAMLDYQFSERRSALRQIFRMDERAYREYWIKATFRGDVSVPPKTLASPDLMRKFVFNAPGGIGYLRANDVDDTVKVVKIDGYLPEDKDYSLQIDESLKE